MKTIHRDPNPPECLEQQPETMPWDEFVGTACHAEVGESLRREQTWICCYCESAVKDNTDSHIEHLTPRGGPAGNRKLTYRYTNLAASCNGGTAENRHCGDHKGRQYDPSRFSAPHDPCTYALFEYQISGEIVPSSDPDTKEHDKAQYMIDILNLNCPRMVGRRRTHARKLQKMLGDPASITWLAEFYLQPDNQGKLKPYYSLSKTLLLQ